MRKNIYIYVDGYDCLDIEEEVSKAFLPIVEKDPDNIKFINGKPENLNPDSEGFLPEWNLGINLEKSFSDKNLLKEIIKTFCTLSKKINREFAAGFCDYENSISEDFTIIDENSKEEDIINKINKICS